MVGAPILAGDEVSIHYDPMIAKLVVWSKDRPSAIAKLKTALREYHIAGLSTNIDFMCNIASMEAFQAGDISTDFIENNEATLLHAAAPSFHVLAQAGLAMVLHEKAERSARQATTADPHSPWGTLTGRQVMGGAGCIPRTIALVIGETEYELVVTAQGGDRYTVECNGESGVIAGAHRDGAIKSEIDGVKYSSTPFVSAESLDLFTDDGQLHAVFPVPEFASTALAASDDLILAPMDGAVIEVLAQPGDTVSADQPVLVLYAMKMQTTLRAPRDGVIATIADPGQVALNAVVMTMEEEEGEEGEEEA